jgi:hypothetical protein
MEGQNRAFDPNFLRNVNGTKSLSFKIYKKYIDTQTGEEVDNPYISYLFSERKVKLYLPEEHENNRWHDFIIKNVSENSSTHLCTYQLEDALVQELSKNGFGMTLDAELRNNMGTANELARFVLGDTDWRVSNESEAFVQTVDEALVYLTFPEDSPGNEEIIKNITIHKIIGQKEEDRSVGATTTVVDTKDFVGKTILAFYSSCSGKPHRFQFIYPIDNLPLEENIYISNTEDRQYYIDFDEPEKDYTVKMGNYELPKGFLTTTVVEDENGSFVTLSAKYRGRRYSFAQ